VTRVFAEFHGGIAIATKKSGAVMMRKLAGEISTVPRLSGPIARSGQEGPQRRQSEFPKKA
jgi:hypothetical protein